MLLIAGEVKRSTQKLGDGVLGGNGTLGGKEIGEAPQA